MISVNETNYSIIQDNDEIKVVVEEVANNVIETGFIPLTIQTNSSVIDITFEAGEMITGNRLLYMENNKAFIADASNINCKYKILGISLSSANMGDLVNIRKTGLITNEDWNLTPNINYYLGTDGNLSSTVENSAVKQLIGLSLSPTDLLIDINTNYTDAVFQWVVPPETRNSPGIVGQQSFDDDYLYICVAPNIWARTLLMKGW